MGLIQHSQRLFSIVHYCNKIYKTPFDEYNINDLDDNFDFKNLMIKLSSLLIIIPIIYYHIHNKS
jgi:hypothetical protein